MDMTASPAPDGTRPSELLTEGDLAALFQVSTEEIRTWSDPKQLEVSIPFVKLGRAVRYRVKDVEAWVASRIIY